MTKSDKEAASSLTSFAINVTVQGLTATGSGAIYKEILAALKAVREECALIAEYQSNCCYAGEDHVFHSNKEIAATIRSGGK